MVSIYHFRLATKTQIIFIYKVMFTSISKLNFRCHPTVSSAFARLIDVRFIPKTEHLRIFSVYETIHLPEDKKGPLRFSQLFPEQ